MLAVQRDGFLRVPRNGDDGNPGAFDSGRERFGHQGVVLDQQDTDGVNGWHQGSPG